MEERTNKESIWGVIGNFGLMVKVGMGERIITNFSLWI